MLVVCLFLVWITVVFSLVSIAFVYITSKFHSKIAIFGHRENAYMHVYLENLKHWIDYLYSFDCSRIKRVKHSKSYRVTTMQGLVVHRLLIIGISSAEISKDWIRNKFWKSFNRKCNIISWKISKHVLIILKGKTLLPSFTDNLPIILHGCKQSPKN